MAKKKKPSLKLLEEKINEKKRKDSFAKRIKSIACTMASPDILPTISNDMIADLYLIKYPPFRAKAHPEGSVTKNMVKKYDDLMNSFISTYNVDFDNNESIPLRLCMSDALLLLRYIENVEEYHNPNAAELKAAFAENMVDYAFYDYVLQAIETIAHDTNVFLSDMHKNIIVANIDSTAPCLYYEPDNILRLKSYPAETGSMKVDGHSRKIIKVVWYFDSAPPSFSIVKPAQLGFKGAGADEPLQVFIQSHALDNLQKRIDITPGIMHFGVWAAFNNDVIPYVKKRNHSLISYELSNERVGYLLVEWVENILLIRTFLFITNDGTPEGDKLTALLGITKDDKTYLAIHTLPAFNAYHMENHVGMSEAFTAAGCGGLLKLRNLEQFSLKILKEQDPASIQEYTADSKHFQGQDKPDSNRSVTGSPEKSL